MIDVVYRVTNFGHDFFNRKVRAYFTDYNEAISFMKENRSRPGEGKLETAETGNWEVMKTIVVKKYDKELGIHLFYFNDGETLIDDAEERYYWRRFKEVQEENECFRMEYKK
jgi:hypothetical protein